MTTTKGSTASVKQASSKSAPILSAGELTPLILCEWAEACESYCENTKDLKPEDYVRKVSYGMRDPRIRDWYRVNKAKINALTLEKYIEEMQKRFLRADWDDTLHDKLLLSTQGDDTFYNWQIEFQSQNALLSGTTSHLDEATVRKHLKTHMNEETKDLVKRDKVKKVEDFNDWLEAVRIRDEEHTRNELKMLRLLQKNKTTSFAHSTPASTSTKPSSSYNTSHTTTSASSSSSSSKPKLPKLSDAKKDLLNRYQGCYRCRCFNVTHRSSECPNGFPKVETYRTLTEADALAVTRQCSNTRAPAPVAAVIDDGPKDVVAAIRKVVLPSAVIEDDEEDTDECIHVSLPILDFPCHISGPTVDGPIPITAMLDHGSGMTLISDALAQRLGL
ncbi:hypothetical protein NEOLEDRAFT_1178974 [Neolentinus lepideus HHB14362 ss-1]|uniref:Retrotransposon gag domain-containing protein n=1 Tax=Neolentinus lepideus HHB14362 ss-1 TaxID=1314782 RepID=A0A165SAZ1_9AGAM|nr:hypothetical protein NEOLEDRAFT_1178974 [Neolentinus lepideus HHB14362 ss-1]